MTPDSSSPAEPKAGPSNLQQRIIYGALGAALLLGCVWFSAWSFGLFFALVQAIMLWEFYRMMEAGDHKPATWLGIGFSLLVFVGFNLGYGADYYSVAMDVGGEGDSSNMLWAYTGEPIIFALEGGSNQHLSPLMAVGFALLMALMLLIIILLLKEMRRWTGAGSPFGNIGATLTGLLYVSLPMSMLNIVAFTAPAMSVAEFGLSEYLPARIFGLLFLIWASDTGAYIAGKSFGKHKLAPSISPGKTWEGWAGGFLLTLGVGWALQFMLPQVPLAHLLVAAAVVAIFGPLGDLAESMLKRSVGVKDSGRILPGHGGLLDRFDAFLLVLPVLALLQLLAG